jgi:hypothetical protein
MPTIVVIGALASFRFFTGEVANNPFLKRQQGNGHA